MRGTSRSGLGKITITQEAKSGELVSGQVHLECWGRDAMRDIPHIVESLEHNVTIGAVTYTESKSDNVDGLSNRETFSCTIDSTVGNDDFRNVGLGGADPPEYGYLGIVYRVTITWVALVVANNVQTELRFYRDPNIIANLQAFRIRWRQTLIAAAGAIALNYLYPSGWPTPTQAPLLAVDG